MIKTETSIQTCSAVNNTFEYADNELIWITAKKKHIPVKKMTTKHINNCIACWNGVGSMIIPEGYLGGKKKWIEIFEKELAERN